MARRSNTTPADARRLDEASAALEPIVVEKRPTLPATDGFAGMSSVPSDFWGRVFGHTDELEGVEATADPFHHLAKPTRVASKHDDARGAMDRMTGHLVRHGLARPGDLTREQARAVAQTCAHRKDSHNAGESDADRAGRHPVHIPKE